MKNTFMLFQKTKKKIKNFNKKTIFVICFIFLFFFFSSKIIKKKIFFFSFYEKKEFLRK